MFKADIICCIAPTFPLRGFQQVHHNSIDLIIKLASRGGLLLRLSSLHCDSSCQSYTLHQTCLPDLKSLRDKLAVYSKRSSSTGLLLRPYRGSAKGETISIKMFIFNYLFFILYSISLLLLILIYLVSFIFLLSSYKSNSSFSFSSAFKLRFATLARNQWLMELYIIYTDILQGGEGRNRTSPPFPPSPFPWMKF